MELPSLCSTIAFAKMLIDLELPTLFCILLLHL